MSVYDYFTGLLGIDDAEQRRRSLERAVARAPLDLQRNYKTIDAAMASRTPARAGMYPEIDATLGGLRPREISAMSDMESEIGRRAAGLSDDIADVIPLTKGEEIMAGLRGAYGAVFNPDSYGKLIDDALRPAADVQSVAADAAVQRRALQSRMAEAPSATAANESVVDAKAQPTSTQVSPQVQQAARRGLLQPQAKAGGAGLLGDFSRNLQDVIAAYGTLQASQPSLVTADDLDKLRPITAPMIIAQTQKIKQAREAAERVAGKEDVKQMKERLAIMRGMKNLTKEDDKKLQREAESVMDARQNVNFIDQALGLIDDAYSYGPLGTGMSQFAAARLAGIEGSAAYDLESVLTSLRSRIGFEKLQEMRQNSPTGGALGQVSDFENRLLQATEGNLTIGVDPARMTQTLLDIRDAQMAMVHGIVDNTGKLRRLESRGDLEKLRSGEFRVATSNDAGASSGRVKQFNPRTGEFE